MSRQQELELLSQLKNFVYDKNKIASCNGNYFYLIDFINSAKSNPAKNDFPDFICSDGIMEHFAITSSQEDKKGSSFKRQEASNDQKTNDYFDKEKKEYFKSIYKPRSFSAYTTKAIYKVFSYDDFKKSFKANFQNHVESLHKSGYKNIKVAFFIEQQGAKLEIYENERFNRFYLLCEDRSMVEFLKDYSSEIDFVFFLAVDTVELIDLSNIDNIIASAKNNLNVKPGKYVKTSILLKIDI